MPTIAELFPLTVDSIREQPISAPEALALSGSLPAGTSSLGTVIAGKFITADSNRDISNIRDLNTTRNVYVDGNLRLNTNNTSSLQYTYNSTVYTLTPFELNLLNDVSVGEWGINKVLTAGTSIDCKNIDMINVDIDSGTIEGVTIKLANGGYTANIIDGTMDTEPTHNQLLTASGIKTYVDKIPRWRYVTSINLAGWHTRDLTGINTTATRLTVHIYNASTTITTVNTMMRIGNNSAWVSAYKGTTSITSVTYGDLWTTGVFMNRQNLSNTSTLQAVINLTRHTPSSSIWQIMGQNVRFGTNVVDVISGYIGLSNGISKLRFYTGADSNNWDNGNIAVYEYY